MANLITPSLLAPPLAHDLSLRALETVNANIRTLNLNALLVYDFDKVDASALPTLAEQFSLLDDAWEFADTEQKQRDFLKKAIQLHRIKGTKAAIELVFSLLGFADVLIDEGRGGYAYDGAVNYDGWPVHGGASIAWVYYRVTVNSLMNSTQALSAQRLCARWAPARCKLYEIIFGGQLIYNAMATHDATYNYGAY